MSTTPGQSGAPLRVTVLADGTQKFQSDMRGVGGAIQGVGRQSGLVASGFRQQESAIRGLSSRLGGLRQGFGHVRSGLAQIAGLFGAGLGIGAIAQGVKALRDFDAGLTALGYSAGLSTQETAALGQQITDMTTTTGRSKQELLGAVDTAEDLGIEIAEIMKNMKGASDFARLLGVNLETLAPALAAVNKIAGPGVSLETQMGLFGIGARHSGMTEEDFSSMMTRVAPRAARMGLTGRGGLTSLLTMTSGAAKFMNPRELPTGLESFLTYFEEGKNRTALGRKGVDTTSVATAFRDIIGAVHHDAKALKTLNLPDELHDFVRASAAGLEEMGRAEREFENFDPAGFQRQLEAAGSGTAAKWDETMQAVKLAFEPVAAGALNWIVENKDRIIGAFNGVVGVAGFLIEQFGLAGGAAALLAGRIHPLLGLMVALGSVIAHLLPEHGKGHPLGLAGPGAEKFYANVSESERKAKYVEELEKSGFAKTAQAAHALMAGAVHEGRLIPFQELQEWAPRMANAPAEAGAAAAGMTMPEYQQAAQQFFGRLQEGIINVFVRTDGETVHAKADKENKGRKQSVTARATVEQGRPRS